MPPEKRQLTKATKIGECGIILVKNPQGEMEKFRIPAEDYELFTRKKGVNGGILVTEYPLPEGYTHTGTAMGGVPLYDTPSGFLEDDMYADLETGRVAIKLSEQPFELAHQATEVDETGKVTLIE